MKKTMGLMITAIFILGSATVTRADYINKRQVRQQQRIYQGIASGALTPREAGRLEREQAKITCRDRRFRSDGIYTPRERARTHRMLNRSSRHIYRGKHNWRAR
jgi:hypothetical protein